MALVRLLVQTVLLALQQIWANRVRAILTTLGIMIGVAAVVVVAATTKGAQGYVVREVSTFGANKVWIFPRMPQGQRDRFSWRQIRLSIPEVDGMKAAAPSIHRLTPVMELSTSVQFGNTVRDIVTVQAVRPAWHDIEQRELIHGRPIRPLDDEERLPVAIINDHAIGELGLDKDPTGDRILVGGRAFTIIGVIETRTVSPMFGGDEARTEVFIPFNVGRMLRPEPRMYVIASTRTAEAYEDVRAEVTSYLRRVRGLAPGDPDTFGIQAIEQAIDLVRRIGQLLTGLTALLVGISLLVGGIGIMNIMLASVSERTREIGLRKAVGAKPRVILTQFLVEAITLCVAGGVIGLIIGYGIVTAIRTAAALAGTPVPEAVVPLWAPILAVSFCAITGVVFGMFPAIKAARLDPIDALRHE